MSIQNSKNTHHFGSLLSLEEIGSDSGLRCQLGQGFLHRETLTVQREEEKFV